MGCVTGGDGGCHATHVRIDLTACTGSTAIYPTQSPPPPRLLVSSHSIPISQSPFSVSLCPSVPPCPCPFACLPFSNCMPVCLSFRLSVLLSSLIYAPTALFIAPLPLESLPASLPQQDRTHRCPAGRLQCPQQSPRRRRTRPLREGAKRLQVRRAPGGLALPGGELAAKARRRGKGTHVTSRRVARGQVAKRLGGNVSLGFTDDEVVLGWPDRSDAVGGEAEPGYTVVSENLDNTEKRKKNRSSTFSPTSLPPLVTLVPPPLDSRPVPASIRGDMPPFPARLSWPADACEDLQRVRGAARPRLKNYHRDARRAQPRLSKMGPA